MQVKKRVPLIVFLLVLALGGLGYYLNIILIPTVKENQLILDQKKTTLEQKEQEYEEVQELNETYSEIEAEVNLALAALPSDKQIPNIPYQLASIADNYELSNFTWSLSTTPTAVPKSTIQSLGINVSFVASYQDTISYLQALASSLRLTDISHISISGNSSLGETESPLNVSLQARAYFAPLSK